MKKLYLLFIFIILILTSCTGDDNFVRSIRSNIYNGSLTSAGSVVSYFLKDKEDIPYIRLELLESLISDIDYEVKYSEGNIIIKNKTNDEKAYIKNNVISFDNYDSFFKPGKNVTPLTAISVNNKYIKMNDYDYIKGNEKVLDLNKYDIYLYQTNNSCFIPFAIFETIFLEMPFGINFVFNGKDYYSISENSLFNRYSLTTYGQNYYQYLNQTEESKMIKKFSYNQLLFILDNYYGLKEDKNIDSFSDYFASIGINENNYNDKLIELTNYYLDDPHSAFVIPSIYDTYNENEIVDKKKKSLGPKSKKIDDTVKELESLRKSFNLFGEPIRINNNVAYLIYDEFVYDSSLDLYKTKISRSQTSADGFAYMYYYLNYIKNNYKGVKKIVIDLSLNTGGYVDSAIDMMGFIKKDYYVNFVNNSTKSSIKINLCNDCNLDNNYNELDSFENVFDFYILISNASFSSANSFASLLKEQNAVKLIGERSAGGACIVQKATLIDGIQLNISGNIAFSDDDNNIIEDGIAPDISVERINMYNPVVLNSILNNLS